MLAAGEARFVKGSLKALDNNSGYFKPTGLSAKSAAESAFQQSGFDVIGKYAEKF